ncbi:hypothetical protein NHX12_004124 [Muraenolepis orangiensis]|uniref:CREB-regulated transcription coactivator 1 n=1 Tax=Muraenolepis orangiensis TaxID=630683 RepID=A0A9Q0IDJ5_9TELE|nr:hypothetical protein NHX12_004124 [Muraenolepis orangiensis]
MATSNNPRKFSEKIALHNQKQAEETAAFEEVMKELSITRAARLQLQKSQYLQLGQNRGQYYGGSLPNVNQIGNGSVDVAFQNSELDTNRTTRHHGLVDRVYRDRNRNTSPHRKPLSLEKDELGLGAAPERHGAGYAADPLCSSPYPGQKNSMSRCKPCKVPGINIFHSPDQLSAHLIPVAHNTGGSLPDLSNIQFPPPLPTPLDSDDLAATTGPLTTSISMGDLVAASQTGLNSSQPVVSMVTQPGQDDMVPLILNTMDSNGRHQRHDFGATSGPQTGLTQLPSSLVQNQSSASTTGSQSSTQSSVTMDINTTSSLHQYRSRLGSAANQSPTSPISNQGFSPIGSPQHNSILGSVFADLYEQQLTSRQTSALSQQLEQFNMMESPIGSNSLYSQASTLNYTQAAMMGLTAGHCNQQQLGYGSHGNIPNIILTVSGESPPGLPKDLVSSLSTDISFDVDSPFPLDDLKIDPLTLGGLHMLNDPDMILADPATEDAFRLDHLDHLDHMDRL